MSDENVRLIQEVEKAFNRGDVGAMVDLLSPDAEWEIAESNPSARTLRGRAEIRPYLEDWRDTVQGLRYEASRYVDAGDAVVQIGTMTSRVGDGTAELTIPLALVTRFDNGVPIRIEEYLDVQEAELAARG